MTVRRASVARIGECNEEMGFVWWQLFRKLMFMDITNNLSEYIIVKVLGFWWSRFWLTKDGWLVAKYVRNPSIHRRPCLNSIASLAMTPNRSVVECIYFGWGFRLEGTNFWYLRMLFRISEALRSRRWCRWSGTALSSRQIVCRNYHHPFALKTSQNFHFNNYSCPSFLTKKNWGVEITFMSFDKLESTYS